MSGISFMDLVSFKYSDLLKLWKVINEIILIKKNLKNKLISDKLGENINY